MLTVNLYTDNELLTLLKSDSNTAFVEIYNRYWAELYTAAFRRIKSKEIAEEIIQDLFTNLWINRLVLDIKLSLKAYLHTAIRNAVLNQLEKNEVRERWKAYLKALSTDSDDSLQAIINSNDLSALVDKEIEKLPLKCREVYQLSRKEHLPNKEIAAKLQISEKTVESHLTKALKTLKIQLRDNLQSLLF
ncbi:RNA polymerase sigma-70 factor [Chitinophaga sp. Cy-1792]|uniref:RNA polymerase sigma-70 factor n=1 Tax=Chitinophaga sp. Cy-1792 TaxID=2608339 RepID=UPI001420B3C9|nr:RNA polymerase sigma-70 factor [Chitinophaga sp. Cy-1792]NIG57351.1 RNA polymerase sigma-70 factor [Chitinophaga sp. Cy-1792]